MNNYFLVAFDVDSVSILKNRLNICSGYVKDDIYFMSHIFNNLFDIEIFKHDEPAP